MNTAACLLAEPMVLPLEPVPVAEPDSRRAGSACRSGEGDTNCHPVEEAGGACPTVPTDRDFEIYEQAVFAGMPQRVVAKKHGISQPRVHQILREMAAWMADNTPAFAAGLTPEQKLRLVHYNVAQQLEHQRCILMEAWETSRTGTETISRTTIVDNVRRTTAYNRPRSGKASFLNAAARVSLAIAKLAGWTPRVMVPDAPQDSPWWQMQEEESVGSWQEAEGSRTEQCSVPHSEQQDVESKNDLSSWAERARKPDLTREEMDAITAEQEATCAALKEKIARLEGAVTQSQNTLSPGTGPLVPEHQNGSPRSRKQEKNVDRRQEFLRGDPPATSIQEFIERKK